jgi:hypothetical protein
MQAMPQRVAVPPKYLCPISDRIMRDPVIATDGNTYERDYIEQHFENNNTSFKTGRVLQTKNLISNEALKEEINKFVQANYQLITNNEVYCPFSQWQAIEAAAGSNDVKKITDLAVVDKRLLAYSLKEMIEHGYMLDRRPAREKVRPLTDRNIFELVCEFEPVNPAFLMNLIYLYDKLIPASLNHARPRDWNPIGLNSVLKAAIRSHKPDIARTLIGHGARPQEALDDAVSQLDLAATTLLLECGADVNAVNERGAAPIHTACLFLMGAGNVNSLKIAMIRLLLSKEADINKGMQVNRFASAAMGRPGQEDTSIGNTPLHLAATFMHHDLAEILLSAGANPNAKNAIGQTALHVLMKNGLVGHKAMISLLLKNGADPDLRDNSGRTPFQLATAGMSLHDAEVEHFREIVELLAEFGANLKAMVPADASRPSRSMADSRFSQIKDNNKFAIACAKMDGNPEAALIINDSQGQQISKAYKTVRKLESTVDELKTIIAQQASEIEMLKQFLIESSLAFRARVQAGSGARLASETGVPVASASAAEMPRAAGGSASAGFTVWGSGRILETDIREAPRP